MQGEGHLRTQEATAIEQPRREAAEETSLVDTLILDLQPLELGDNQSLCSSRPVGIGSYAARVTSTRGQVVSPPDR